MTKRRTRWRVIIWCSCALAIVLTLILWLVGLVSASGVGLGRLQPPGWTGGNLATAATARSNFEISLARGALMMVRNGTRTDVIYYDPNMGCTVWPGSQGTGLYEFRMNRAAGPIVWWPHIDRPAPWAGTYVLIPFWMILVLPFGGIAALLLTGRRKQPNACKHCGYDLSATPTGPCPECGRR
jgi:hypothetical protein